jgi:hypothetical protein
MHTGTSLGQGISRPIPAVGRLQDDLGIRPGLGDLETQRQPVIVDAAHRQRSPAAFCRTTEGFRKNFARDNNIPWMRFGKDAVGNKLELMRPHLNRQAATGRSGGAAIGVAQEFQRVWTAYERHSPTGAAQWWFTKDDRRVSCYYFYLWDVDFGPAFVIPHRARL